MTAQVVDNLQELAPGSARDVVGDAVEQLQGHAGVGVLLAADGALTRQH